MLTFGVLSTLSVTVPGADTAVFYLSSTSSMASSNLLPLRIASGAGGFASLAGGGAIGQFYFIQGRLAVLDPAGSSNTYHPFISSISTSSGCSTFGPLGFTQQSKTGACALYDSFQIQSDTESSQLGAKLVFNYQGGFYSCSASQDIWYKVSPVDGPSDCSEVDLYTIPVNK